LLSGWVRSSYAAIVAVLSGVTIAYTAIWMLPYNFLHAMATRAAGGKSLSLRLRFYQGVHTRLAVIGAICVIAGVVWHRRCSGFRVPYLFTLIAAVLPTLFVQRVVPFERVWLFALPLYFIIAGAGLSVFASKISPGRNASFALVFVVAALVTWSGVPGFESDSVLATNEGRG